MPTEKTKTSPSGLTLLEQKELERRGFLVKLTDVPIGYFLNGLMYRFYLWTIMLPAILGIALGYITILSLSPSLITSIILGSVCIGIYKLYRSLSLFFLCRYTYLASDNNKNTQIILGGTNNPDTIKEYLDSLFAKDLTLFMQPSEKYGNSAKIFIPIINIGFICIIMVLQPKIFIGIFLVCLLTILYKRTHKLYVFGNIGSKIQSLTPRITEESDKIEKEFSTEMNFRTLSYSFDTLAKDFSQISTYVIKLETIEQKANKGNLFDSEKYIGSLREDIAKPLISLRDFLQKKKTELQSSQEEMKKVKVGGSGEAENLELQSKRSEPLIDELTENIEKLSVMIEKFGKI